MVIISATLKGSTRDYIILQTQLLVKVDKEVYSTYNFDTEFILLGKTN